MPKIDLRSPRIDTEKHERLSKSQSEEGELGIKEKSPSDLGMSKVEQSGQWATAQDLVGLNFEDHTRGGNPYEYERQITKLQAKKMQELRSELGMSSMTINSGKRKPEYNAKLDGAAKDSAHLYGMACDVSTVGMSDPQRVAFVRAATKVGFGGVGIYSTFIHVDTSKVRMWVKTKISDAMRSALDDHVKGRIGQVVDIKTGLPMQTEEGEVGTQQQGQSTDITPPKTEEKTKGFFDQITDAYNLQTSILNKVLPSVLSEGGRKSFEAKLEEYSKNIPRKETISPDLGGLFMQNNTMINVIQNKKNKAGINPYLSSDDPAPFVNPQINEHH